MGAVIGFHNFFACTKGVFQITNLVPQRKPDFESTSGSKYWYGGVSSEVLAKLKKAETDEEWLAVYRTLRKDEKRKLYVIRQSNHWCYGSELGNAYDYKEENGSFKHCKVGNSFNAHKNKIASCKWFLSVPNNNQKEISQKEELCGIIKLHDFKLRLTEFERIRYERTKHKG